MCRLKALFREKADHAWAVPEGVINRRSAQLRLSEQQNARNSPQVQRRVINSVSNDEVEGARRVIISVPPVLSRVHAPVSYSRSRSPQGLEVSIRGRVSDDEGEGARTLLITAPPILSRVQASPTHIRSRSPKGLEVSISSKDKKRYGAPDSPRRHVVIYEARKEQFSTPVLKSKIIRPVKEDVQSRSGRGIPQDRKRYADRSPDGRLLIQEQGPEIGENRPGKPCTDLRELLTRPNSKRLKSSTKESAERLLSKPMGPPVDYGGKIARSDLLPDGILKKDLEQGLPPPSKKHSTISVGTQNAVISKDLVTPEIAGYVQESRKNAKTIVPVNGVQSNLKSVSVCADDRIRSLTASGSHCVNPKPMVLGTKGREGIEACRSENAFNNMDFKMVDGDGVGSCVQTSTSSSGMLRNLGDVITKSDLGDQSKDGGLDIYVSLTVEEAKIARHTDSRIVSENQSGMEGVVRCILGKRFRESSQHEPTLDSSMAARAAKAERPVQQQKEGPKDSHDENSLLKVSSSLANVSETLQERKNATPVAPAEEQSLTSQAQSRNGSFKIKNHSEGKNLLDHVDIIPTNVVPLIDAIPVVGTLITGNTGDMQPRDCKGHRAEKESGPSSPVHKLSRVGQNDAGCSYITPEVSTPTNGGDIREKIPWKYGVDYNTSLQTLPNSLLSLKSGNQWNSRTLRYGRPRSADALANHVNISSKSGCEPTSASGKSELKVVSVQIEEESVYGGGQDYVRQPESSNGTVTSRSIGSLSTQHPLLVCELGNPGGLPLDGKMIKVDTLDESLRKDQPSRVAAVSQESMLPAETDSTTRLERFQSLNTAEDEPQVTDKICPTDDLPSKEIIQPTMIASNGGAHPSLQSCTLHRANAPQGARASIEDDIQHCLDSTSRGFPLACISTASLSDCSGASGEAKLEINIPIEEEELEICLPLEEDEVDAVPEDQIRRLWGSSNRDITPWKLLQKNPSQDT